MKTLNGNCNETVASGPRVCTAMKAGAWSPDPDRTQVRETNRLARPR